MEIQERNLRNYFPTNLQVDFSKKDCNLLVINRHFQITPTGHTAYQILLSYFPLRFSEDLTVNPLHFASRKNRHGEVK
jgi:hypothetical protein